MLVNIGAATGSRQPDSFTFQSFKSRPGLVFCCLPHRQVGSVLPPGEFAGQRDEAEKGKVVALVDDTSRSHFKADFRGAVSVLQRT